MGHTVEARSSKQISGGVHTSRRHDSAHKHVTGSAEYIDDMPEPAGTLHAYLGLSERAHATISSIDLSTVRSAPGVVDVLIGADVPGENDISPTARHDEPVLAEGQCEFMDSQFSLSSPKLGRRPVQQVFW